MAWKRRRGTAIVETAKGILVASGRRKVFLLPGGGTERGERRERAACRELEEETSLHATNTAYLFSYIGKPHEAHGGGQFQDHHKVFIVKAEGVPRPRHEIKHVAYYRPGSGIKLSSATKEIIEKYYSLKEENDFSKYLSTTPTLMKRVARVIKHVIKLSSKPLRPHHGHHWKRIDDPPRWVQKHFMWCNDPRRVYYIKGRHIVYKCIIRVGDAQGQTEWCYYRRPR